MKTSEDFYKDLRVLEQEVQDTLVEAINTNQNGLVVLEDVAAAFDDEAGNYVEKVSAENVYFRGNHEEETYPLSDMGIKDMLYVLTNIE